ncbi:unnamed protein product [Caenorhabditis bovis]|uniref:C-type lectin domain-containing protein n=1 Tax=Caenorhabditis bovis TaxID=2654633 RepID=A0A8S1F7J3_9PELO|nr:unnamed protein product [Caenorhabditis bovis]
MKLLLVLLLAGGALASWRPEPDCDDYTCPSGFQMFDRADTGTWCIKVVTDKKTWWEAEKECRCKYGATLSGIESDVEHKYILNELQKGGVSGAVWIGAYRRAACRGPVGNWRSKSECTNEYMFQFTDYNARGRYIFSKWQSNEPTSQIRGNEQENCVAMNVSPNSGSIKDEFCSAQNIGFVCGVSAEGKKYGASRP